VVETDADADKAGRGGPKDRKAGWRRDKSGARKKRERGSLLQEGRVVVEAEVLKKEKSRSKVRYVEYVRFEIGLRRWKVCCEGIGD
jgi:hypothetical protein